MPGDKYDFSGEGREIKSRKSRIERVLNRPHVSDRSREMAIVLSKFTPKFDGPVIRGPLSL